MNILVTGSQGMIGKSLVRALRNLSLEKDKTREGLNIEDIYECDRETPESDLRKWCESCDFVFHLAGINRSDDPNEFLKGNYKFLSKLLGFLEVSNNRSPVMLASSIQASLVGRYEESDYGLSKKKAEDLLFNYGINNGVDVFVFRFPNVMGHSRPNYNSAISTFCWAIATDSDFYVDNREAEIEVLYINDLVNAMLDLLIGVVHKCEYRGVDSIPSENGRFCYVLDTHIVTLGHVVDLLESFNACPDTLKFPSMPENSFEKKLYSTYLTYLPKNKIKYALNMKSDERGSFTELLRPENCGQVSVNITKPGVTKGNHWHSQKWEMFIVVAGEALISQRNIETGEKIDLEVSGSNIEAVYMIPGWTHNITNLSDTDDLVTVMICNEAFDSSKPDTYYEEV